MGDGLLLLYQHDRDIYNFKTDVSPKGQHRPQKITLGSSNAAPFVVEARHFECQSAGKFVPQAACYSAAKSAHWASGKLHVDAFRYVYIISYHIYIYIKNIYIKYNKP